MREVTLLVRHRDEPESDVSADHPDVIYRSLSSMTGSGTVRKRIIELAGPTDSIETFLDDFRAKRPVTEAKLMTDIDAPRVFVAVTMDVSTLDPIAEKIAKLGVHFKNGTTIIGGWEQWTVYLSDGDELQQIVEAIEASGNETEIARNVPIDDVEASDHIEFSRLIHDLTPRQREVLTTAIAFGYYRPKKDTSIEEIADAVGIASTTAWEHLARAERKIMEEIGTFLGIGS